MSEPELKPCPFCGDKAMIIRTVDEGGVEDYAIECYTCPAQISACSALDRSLGKTLTEERALEAWNTRAGPKWISVKDKLPPYYDHVLVRSIDKWGGVDIEMEALQKGGEQEWRTYYEHWMPLPEPPEGE